MDRGRRLKNRFAATLNDTKKFVGHHLLPVNREGTIQKWTLSKWLGPRSRYPENQAAPHTYSLCALAPELTIKGGRLGELPVCVVTAHMLIYKKKGEEEHHHDQHNGST